MNSSKARLVIDIVLVTLLVFEMLYLVTGDALHEIFGIAFFGTIGAHLILTRRMSGALLKRARGRSGERKSLSAMGKLRLGLALFLAIDGAVLLVSSVAISNLLADIGIGLAVGGAYELWTLVHIASAYILCGLVVFHAASHWATFFKGSMIPYNPARRHAIQSWAMGGAAIGAAVLGITSVIPLSSRLNGAFAGETDQSNQIGSVDAGGNDGSGQAGSSSQGQSGESSSTSDADNSNPRSQSLPGNGRGYGRGPRGYSGGSDQAYGNSSPNSGNGSATPNDSGSSSNGSSGSSGSGSSSTSSICTLCPKRCSLSSPRCNRPYSAGLL